MKNDDLQKNKNLFAASEALEQIDYEPLIANGIMDIVCNKVGVSPTQISSISPEAEILIKNPEVLVEQVSKRKKELDKNVVVMQPFSTLEDQGAFK